MYSNITAAVGSTPLVRINKLAHPDTVVLAKMESFNPCSSVKDRIGLAMVEAAEKAGRITSETVLIEPTSGNTGIALAFVCAQRGYTLKLTMPESMSIERRKLLRMLGAEIVLTPAEKGMKGAVEEAMRLKEELPNALMLQQFSNLANPDIHRHTTAEEIWNDTDGQVDIFIAGVGTGGTVTGCGEALKERKPEIKVIAVEPAGSPVLSGGKPGKHKIQGIGAGFVPDVLNRDILDEVFQVTDEQAMDTSKLMAVKEGILGGISAGAALHAAIEISKRPESKGKTIVFIMCDTGERYLSTELYA
ncbi:MAG: cysteine synthase A [Sedimentisphaerales bacterium]|nr:cysteine synthase A [Sedimentisphaerales bacterium]